MNRKFHVLFTRFIINIIPCIRGAGGRVIFISEDFMRLTVKLTLSWRTRNVVGTIYGGSLYGSTDPFYMLMLREILGKDYVVWDKGCTFRFKRPAKEDIFAEFVITPFMLAAVKEKADAEGEVTFTWPLEYKSKDGTIYVEFEKMLYLATKTFYDEKQKRRTQQTESAR